ncbi:dihydroxyacetone kinase subunit DhaK, partial [Streptomyces shenzhenensis]
MTATADASAAYAAEALAGFVDANPGHVRAVRGGVVRADLGPDRVRLVIGGGSGHSPAFAGWVGPGLADAAVCGDVFAAPSAARISAVSRAVAPGRGVILGFGNYTGDVLQFGRAAEDLRAEGIDTRLLAVTDDIASAPAQDAGRRRGIAGDLVVFKITAAAAERGLPIDEVVSVAHRANGATRTIGCAFSGCTLPGADEPLFTVEAGTMALGLGIHGEPGLETVTRPDSEDLAALLVERVLAESHDLPDDRVAIVLNGFGAVNNDALFVLHHHVASHLRRRGLRSIAPHVGQQVSSLDMAGVSLTVTGLDDELEPLWTAPAQSAAFHRAAFRPRPAATPAVRADAPPDAPPASTAQSRAAARIVVEALGNAAAAVRRHDGGSAMHRLVPQVLVSFLRAHPDVDVTVR